MSSRAIEARKMEVTPVKPEYFFSPFIVTVSFLQRSVIAILLSAYNMEGKKKMRSKMAFFPVHVCLTVLESEKYYVF